MFHWLLKNRLEIAALGLLLGVSLSFASSQADEKNAAVAEKAGKLDVLSWLAGHWIMEHAKQTTEEIWLEPKDGLMVGCSRTISPGKQPFFEFIRIQVVDGKIHYIAQPKGSPPSSFPMTEGDAEHAVFENPAHDFPQRITYRIDPEGQVHARIDGMISGKPRSENWVYRKK